MTKDRPRKHQDGDGARKNSSNDRQPGRFKNKGRQGGAANTSKYGGPKPASFEENGDVWIWGLHAVAATLDNNSRKIKSLLISRNAANRLNLDPDVLPNFAICLHPKELDEALPAGAVHQGAAIKVAPLEPKALDDAMFDTERPLVILDQVTDPQNIGAIYRSAAAFNMGGIIMQTRNSPPLGGALAKAAAGAVETVPEIRVVNISRSIQTLTDAGWRVVGLAGESETDLQDAIEGYGPVAFVLGAEGAGLRPGVAQSCTSLARIPIHADMESLNVSNSAAIAFYELTRKGT